MSAQRPQRRPTGPSTPRAVPAPCAVPAASPHPAPSLRRPRAPRRPRAVPAPGQLGAPLRTPQAAASAAGTLRMAADSDRASRPCQGPMRTSARSALLRCCPQLQRRWAMGTELLAEGAAPSLRPAQGPVLELQLHICSRSLTSLPPAQPVRAAPPVSPQHRVLARSLSLGVWGGPASSPSSAPAPPPLSPGHLLACTGCSHRPPPHTSGRTCHPQHHRHVGAGTSLPRRRSCVW